MTTPAEERRLWDACDPANLEFAVWAEPDYRDGIAWCLPRVLALLTEHPEHPLPAGPALDLGCGIGRLTIPFAAVSNRLTVGVDISARMLDQARRDALAAGLAPSQIIFTIGDGRHLGLREYAVGWSVLMFQHIPFEAQEGYLREIGVSMLPGGRFLLQVAHGHSEQALAYEHPTPGRIFDAAGAAGLTVTDFDLDDRYPWYWIGLHRPA